MQFTYGTPSAIRSLLQKYDASVRKCWGQNFLVDRNHIRALVRILIEGEELVKLKHPTRLEIGPGTGALTLTLIDELKSKTTNQNYHAVEIDPVMVHAIREQMTNDDPIHLYCEDAVSFLKNADEKNNVRFESVFGNLPYYITTDLLILSSSLKNVKVGHYLVQKEFADRLVKRECESSLAVFLWNRGEWKVVHKVPPTAFYPVPGVDSSFLRFTAYPSRVKAPSDVLEKLLRMSYRGKRKKIVNSWRKGEALLDINELIHFADSLNLNIELRAEDFLRDDFYKLANKIDSHKQSLNENSSL